MKLTEERYKEMKREVEDAQAEYQRARGAFDQLMKRLQKDFECDTIEAGKKLLVKLEARRDAALQEFTDALSRYEKRWKKEA